MKPMPLLRKQHQEVEGLFRRLSKTQDPEERLDVVGQLHRSLMLHMRIEEEMFYPAVREIGTKKAEEMVPEAFEEHAVVRLVVEQLPRVDPEDERFEAKMTVLRELIQHHVKEEETVMFKLARKIGDEELAELGERMTATVEAEIGRSDRGKPRRRPRAA